MFVKRFLLATMLAVLCISATRIHAQGTDASSVVTRYISATNAHDFDGAMALMPTTRSSAFLAKGDLV